MGVADGLAVVAEVGVEARPAVGQVEPGQVQAPGRRMGRVGAEDLGPAVAGQRQGGGRRAVEPQRAGPAGPAWFHDPEPAGLLGGQVEAERRAVRCRAASRAAGRRPRR